MRSPEEIVQLQLDYYNAHNLEKFAALYHDDIEILNLVDNTLIYKGIKTLRERYTERFKLVDLHAELANRIVIGNKVIDHEIVKGIHEGQVVKAVAVYEVEGELIKKVWFIYE